MPVDLVQLQNKNGNTDEPPGYEVEVRIRGIAGLLQHKFPLKTLDELSGSSTKKTAKPDYSLEWMETMYVSAGGILVQPSSHIEGALVKAASSFQITGKRGKTWKDPIKAYVRVAPDEIVHLHGGKPVTAPGPELAANPLEWMKVDVRRVIVQRAAVARARLFLEEGWELAFTLTVIDPQVQVEPLFAILQEAGRAVGISDHRPKYGRFEVTSFIVPDKV